VFGEIIGSWFVGCQKHAFGEIIDFSNFDIKKMLEARGQLTLNFAR
jgi:hypothetical protein